MLTYERFQKATQKYFNQQPDSEFEKVKCIFCEPSAPRVLLFSKGQSKIYRCKCGFVYSGRQPKQRLLDKFYKKSAPMSYWSNIKENKKEVHRQSARFSRAADFFKDNKHINSVLDLGCGNGAFLKAVLDVRPDIFALGADTNWDALHQAEAKGVSTLHATLEETLYRSSTYDFISLWGVLEHVKDPSKILNMVRSKLTKDGYILVCVPNVESEIVCHLWSQCYTFCDQHLWYFSALSLTRVLCAAGFSVNHWYTVESEATPLMRYRLGFPPYEATPVWVDVGSDVMDLSLDIIRRNKGYKIVMVAQATEKSIQGIK